MTDTFIYIFYILLFIPVNSFILYPFVIFIISKFVKAVNYNKDNLPKVSLLIAAYNEEKVIEERLKNIASLDYDFSKIEVHIGSDYSSDRTNEILLKKQNEYHWLKIHLFKERRGKASVLNDLIKLANYDIVVFSDANTEFKKDALKNLVYQFQEEKIGGVCGKLILTDDEVEKTESVEERKYWLYETVIKESESNLGLLFAANGGIFAIRKKLFEQIPIKKAVTDDLFISLSVIGKGYKFVYAKDACAVESVGKDVTTEFKRKVRFSATNFQTMTLCFRSIIRQGLLISYAFFSHKISRWFLPFNLILLYLFSVLLFGKSIIINNLFYLQSLFYLLALLGYIGTKIRVKFFLFSLPYFFVIANIAVIKGFFKFLNKKHSVIWESTKR
jgi:biofilm PGA synthesis N-glycosyltransferase PgaC